MIGYLIIYYYVVEFVSCQSTNTSLALLNRSINISTPDLCE